MKIKLVLSLLVGCAGLALAQTPPTTPPPAANPATNGVAQRIQERQRLQRPAVALTNAPAAETNPPTFRPRPGQVDPTAAGAPPGIPSFPAPTLPAPATTTATPLAVPGAPGAGVPAVGAVAAPGVAANVAGGAVEKAEHNYNFNGAPLEQIITQYEELVGRTQFRSYVGTGVVAEKTIITFKTQKPLTKSEAINALETVLGMNGVVIVPVGTKFMKVLSEGGAGTAGGKVQTVKADELPESGQYLTHIVQLKYASVQDVQTAITPFIRLPNSITPIPSTQTIVLRDYTENVKRMLEIIEKIDVASPFDVKTEVIPIKYALADDVAQVLSSLTTGGGVTSVGRSSGGRSAGGGQQYGARGGGQLGTTPNALGGQRIQPGASPLNTAATGQTAFQQNIQRIVQNASQGGGQSDFQILGQAKIIADSRTNSLLIFANEQDMKAIKDIIAKIDVVLAQVLIESIVMEVTIDSGQNVLVSALQRPKNLGSNVKGVGGFKNGNPIANTVTNIGSLAGGFSYLTQIGDFDVAAAAIANDSRINVLSRPSIQTSHAVQADIKIGDTVPYVSGSFQNINGGASSQYQQTFVGITLQVTPLINPDGLVVMDIVQDIQQLGPTTKIDNNDVPTTTQRSANAKVAVRDRDTIMLGGFISTLKSDSKSGVPLLMDIPGLGVLFRSHNKTNKKVELIVLLRPTVLPTPESAALLAATETDKLPGVRKAVMEIREDNRKDQLRIEKELREKMKSNQEQP